MMENIFNLSETFFVSVLFLSIRLGTVLLMTPLLGVFGLPIRFRIAIVLSLSVVLAYGIPQWRISAEIDFTHYLLSACSELALGLVLSLGILVAFGSISFAGQLLDTQIGFGIAQIFDPMTQRQVPIISGVFNQFSVIFFFILDLHHALLRGLALSAEIFPLGAAWPFEKSALFILKQAAGIFTLGFALVAPIVFCLLLIEFSLAVLTRNLPQLNMFIFGVPIKIVVGLIALSLWFLEIGGVFRHVYASIFDSWKVVFRNG